MPARRITTTVLALLLGMLCLAAGAPAAPLSTFSGAETLEEIRAIIDAAGYKFTVADNPVTQLPAAQRAALHSRHAPLYPSPAKTVELGPLARLKGKVELPASLDWRDMEGKSYIGPVRNQLSCGSCYAFGASAAAEGVINVARDLSGSEVKDFSESFIVWCLSSLPQYNEHFEACEGSDYDYAELDALTQVGIASEADFPYTPVDPGGCPAWQAPLTRFASWHRIPCGDVEAIKLAIMTYGPIDAAVWVGNAFDAYQSGIYEDDLTGCEATPCYYTDTNHAIALVGWNDNGDAENEGYWILRNSWGTEWGEGGYMRIKYNAARVACEATYLVPFAGSAKSLYLPHLTGSDPAWTDVLEVDNAGGTDAGFNLSFKPGSGSAQNLTVPARSYASFDLNAIDSAAEAAVVTTDSDGLIFRQGYVSTAGGLAECPASETTMTRANLVFSNFSPFVAWKGLALYNTGEAEATLSLTAFSGGQSLGTVQATIPAGGRLKARPSELWPSLSDEEVERVAVTSDQPLSGLTLTGAADGTRLTCLPAAAAAE